MGVGELHLFCMAVGEYCLRVWRTFESNPRRFDREYSNRSHDENDDESDVVDCDAPTVMRPKDARMVDQLGEVHRKNARVLQATILI